MGTEQCNVVAIALEDIVLLEANLDVQVAWRSAVGARFTIASAADAHAVVDAGGDFDFQRLLAFDLALTTGRRCRGPG